jgi:hypothetical protein
MKIFKQIENEINDYLTKDVEISEGYRYSQYKIIKRIMLFANSIYPKGKIDKQGNYKYWVDVISPRIDSEVKNIDFDTKDIMLYSDSKADSGVMMLCNLALREWLRENGKAEEINDAVEEGSGWGNVVWKKIKGGYEKVDLKNLYVINQTARTLEDSPVIERHILTQSYLRTKKDVWDKDIIDKIIKSCGNKSFSVIPQGVSENKETPYYEIYERNGEVSEATLFEAQGKKGGDENKYVNAKIICAGLGQSKVGEKYVLFAKEMEGIPYKEYHRGRYSGRWFRTGIYEMLFDIQTRANEISNQIAVGLGWASKTIFKSNDGALRRNVLRQLNSGSVIRTSNLEQLNVRMEGMDQLLADWNRLMTSADKLCNSYEVVTGEGLPSGTSFKLGFMVNQNATKLFDFLREKLALSLQDVFQDWVVDELMSDLNSAKIIRLTGEESGIRQFYTEMVNGWYINNLMKFPPHTTAQADDLKKKKLQEAMENPTKFVETTENWLSGIKPRVAVIITGENINLIKDLESLSSFISLETDPVRRTALIEMAMRKQGINVDDLPKTPPVQPTATPVASLNALAAQLPAATAA